MTTFALLLALAYVLAAFGLRTFLQLRRTGDSGWRMGGARTPATTVSHLSFGLAPVAMLVGLVLAVLDAGAARSWSPPAGPLWTSTGLVLALAGVLVTVASQLDLGESWRIGVDEDERTELVTTGLYRWVRNPIFTGVGLFLVGEALLVPNAWTAVGALLGIVGVQVQTRVVEEPYLVATHGGGYLGWADRTGRFLPGIGRGVSRTAAAVAERADAAARPVSAVSAGGEARR